MMKVWTCNDFEGHWPVGAAAVVVAETEEQAKDLLDFALSVEGLGRQEDGYTLKTLDINKPEAIVLVNGDY